MIRDGRIEHEQTYPHPPERVWRALTEPAELGAWLMPTDFVALAGHLEEDPDHAVPVTRGPGVSAAQLGSGDDMPVSLVA